MAQVQSKELPKLTPLSGESKPKEEQKKQPVNIKYQRDKDREKVQGVFRFHEVPGGSMSFVFRAYKEDPVERYDFVDGNIYTIPLGVAKHLNKNIWYPVHGFLQDENGQQSIKVNQKVRRCSFQSLEFIDIDDLSPIGSPLATGEFVNQGMSGIV